jgi:mediator of RNA polymerase II transcription subunit 12
MLRSLVLRDSHGVIKALSLRSSDPHVGSWIDCIATKLLVPTADAGTQVTFDQILELTNEFTLPFCQLKISLSLSMADQNNPDAAERIQTHLDLFTKAMDNAVDAENTSWTGMLSSLSPEITHHLKSRAQTRFLDLLPSLRTPPQADATLEQSLQTAENLLSVVDAIIRGGSMGRSPQLVPAMVDKLVDLWEVLSSPSTDLSGKNAVLNHWLPALLALITLHTSTFDSSKAGFEVRARTVIVLSGLLQELSVMPPAMVLAATNSSPPSNTLQVTLANRIFDLACLLVDNLNDEVRNQCLRVVNASADARLRYIFSFARNPAEHLMLSHKDKNVPVTTTGGRPQVGPGHLLGTPASLWAQTVQGPERLTAFHFRRWEMLNEPTPNVGENDTALSLGLFEARKVL